MCTLSLPCSSSRESTSFCRGSTLMCRADMQLRHPCANPKVINLRDVAYAHSFLRPGVLYRGGCLYGLSEEDAVWLQQQLGIKTVIDLRTELEREMEPDTPLPDAAYHTVPLTYGVKGNGLGLYNQILNHMLDHEIPEAIVAQAYVRIITEQWENVIHALIMISQEEIPVLLHCRHGRDRTGLVEAILLWALEIPYQDILKSFLLSNAYMHEKNAKDFVRMSAGMDDIQKAQLWCMFEVREKYLSAALEAITKPMDDTLVKELQNVLIRRSAHRAI